ncbi:Oligosaccharyl transferase STT3 subunit [Fragilaria crotonensis]|nr:Oligosaccharyl transferase STT3 subunit [Fragilaria crotonensis]
MRISGSILLLLVAAIGAQSDSNPVCEVCGAGKVISVPDEIVTVPGQPTISCADLQANGLSGMIEERFCGLIPTLINPTCVCVEAAPSPPTTPEVSPPTQVPIPLAPNTAPAIATVAPISSSPASPSPIALPESDGPTPTDSTIPAPVSVDFTSAPVTTAPVSAAPDVETSESPLEPPVEPPAEAPVESGGLPPTDIDGPVTEPSHDKGAKGDSKEPNMKDSKEMKEKKEKHARGDNGEGESSSGKEEKKPKEESPSEEKPVEDTPKEGKTKDEQPEEEKPDETIPTEEEPEEEESKEEEPEEEESKEEEQEEEESKEEESHDEVSPGDEPPGRKGSRKKSDKGDDSTGDDDDDGNGGAKKDSSARAWQSHRQSRLPVDKVIATVCLLGASYVAYRILWWSYKIRLQAIEEYGPVIHEFDPYFNYRATEYLYEHGAKKFFTWFDYMSWYPLGRPVGSTIYPGMQFTAVWIKKYILPNWSINDVCCYVPAWFGIIATFITGLIAYECSLPENSTFTFWDLLVHMYKGNEIKQLPPASHKTLGLGISSPSLECALFAMAIMAIVPGPSHA